MTYEQYTNGGGVRRSSQEIQSDLQSIRGEIQGTLHALSNQLQPGQLLHQAWVTLRGGTGGGRFLRNLSRAVEENPLPVVLIGAGFGYLIYSDARRTRHGYSYEAEHELSGETEGGIGDKLQGGAGRARGKAQEGAGKLREFTQSAKGGAHKLKEGAHDFSENVRDKLQTTRGKMHDIGSHTQEEWRHMSERAREAGERGREIVHEQPLILAGLGLAFGAALAAFAPMSRKEHEMLGKTGRQLKDQARQAAHEAADKAKAVGSDALETAKSETVGESRQGSGGGDVSGQQQGLSGLGFSGQGGSETYRRPGEGI